MKKWTELHSTEKLRINLPLNKKEPFNVPACLKNYDYHSIFYKTFKNSKLTEHFVIIKNLSIHKRTFYNTFLFKRYKPIRYRLHYLFKKPTLKIRNKKLLLVFDVWSAENLYHFYFFTLEKLELFKQTHKLDDYLIVVPSNPPRFVNDLFKLLKYSHIISFPIGKTIKGDITAFTSGNEVLLPSPLLISKLRKTILEKVNSNLNLGSKIYISRKKSNERHIDNEEEMVSMLNDFNFIKIYAEDFSIIDQISIMHNAKTVISPHGAGLSNIIFMKHGSNVIEINNEIHEQSVPHYMSISSISKLNYYYFDSKYEDGNFKVDLNKLKNLLSQINLD